MLPVDLGKVVGLDFESFFDSKYSLRAKEYNTSEYIRDPQFVAHCVGIKIGNGPTVVYWYEEIEPALRAIDWSTHYLLCHNGPFDGFILSHHYGIVPMMYLCTLSMARALHSNQIRASLDAVAGYYGVGNKLPNALAKMKGHRVIPAEIREEATAYTAMDVDLMVAIFKTMIAVYPEAELRLIDITIRMFTQPIFDVDLALAQEELDAEIAEKAAKVADCGFDIDELMSAGKLAKALVSLGVEPPMKISKRTGQSTYAFSLQDEEFIALGAHPDKKVRNLIAARIAVKSTLGETRANRFLKAGADGMALPVLLNYCGAHTTRWSGGNKLNMQNLPRGERDKVGNVIPATNRLRRAIKAPPGHHVVVCDSAQIEARMTAWLAGQLDLLEQFRNREDVYSLFASEAYGVTVDRKRRAEDGSYPDFEKGFVGKVCVLGLGYQMGAARLQGTLALGLMGDPLDLPLSTCERLKRVYRRKNNKIVALWEECEGILYKMFMKRINQKRDEYTTIREGVLEFDEQTIWLPNGLGLHYPDLRGKYQPRWDKFGDYTYRSNNEYPHIYGGLLTENLVQALSRIVVGTQMIEVADKWRVATMTHDEIVCIAPKAKAEECLDDMLRVMSAPPAWCADVPLAAEGGFAEVYSK